MKKIILLLSLLFISSCVTYNNDCHAYVKFINNSDKRIYCVGTGFDKIEDVLYPNDSYEEVLPHDGIKLGKGSNPCYEDTFGNSDKNFFYILDYEKLGDNPSAVLKTDDMVLKRFSFTLKEMQDANWTVTYDGN